MTVPGRWGCSSTRPPGRADGPETRPPDVGPQEEGALASAWRLLTDSRPPEQPLDDPTFDEWADLVQAESMLAGVVATAMAGGGVDPVALAHVRSVVDRPSQYGAAWRADLRAVLEFVGSDRSLPRSRP